MMGPATTQCEAANVYAQLLVVVLHLAAGLNLSCTARRGGITHLRFLTQQLHESIIHIMWAPSEIAYRWVPCVFRRAGNVCAYMPLRAVSRGGQAQLGDAGGSSHEPHNNWLWLRRGVQDVHAADEKTSAQLPCAATGWRVPRAGASARWRCRKLGGVVRAGKGAGGGGRWERLHSRRAGHRCARKKIGVRWSCVDEAAAGPALVLPRPPAPPRCSAFSPHSGVSAHPCRRASTSQGGRS